MFRQPVEQHLERIRRSAIGVVEEFFLQELRQRRGQFPKLVQVALEARGLGSHRLGDQFPVFDRVLDQLLVRAVPFPQIERWHEMVPMGLTHGAPGSAP
jgi:hypothetical protein